MSAHEVAPEARPARRRDRVRLSALRLLAERRLELLERMLETGAERVWEDCVERRPWLQPLEAWIAERHRARLADARGYSSDGELGAQRRRAARRVSARGRMRGPLSFLSLDRR